MGPRNAVFGVQSTKGGKRPRMPGLHAVVLTATRTDKLKPEERRFVPCQVLTSNRELAANCFQSARETQTDDERVMYLTWRKHRVETARCQFAYRRRHSFRAASSHLSMPSCFSFPRGLACSPFFGLRLLSNAYADCGSQSVCAIRKSPQQPQRAS